MLRSEHQRKYRQRSRHCAAHKRILTISLEMWSSTLLAEEGRSHFELLRHRTRRQKDHLVYYVFDLLYLICEHFPYFAAKKS